MTTAGSDLHRLVTFELRRRVEDARDMFVHCLEQLDDDDLHWRSLESQNSVSNIVLHVCGNMRQWIVSAAGGTEDLRDRPAEFSDHTRYGRDDLLARLRTAVDEALAVIDALPAETMGETRCVQGMEETVFGAVLWSVAHLAGHAQEVVYITRLRLGEKYRFRWVPRTVEEGAPA